MSAFLDDAIQASAAVDALFADAWLFLPMTQGPKNGPWSADASRPAGLVVQAILVEPEAKPNSPNAFDARAYRRPTIEFEEPRIEISPAARTTFVDGSGAEVWIGDGDQLQRQNDGATYRVIARYVTISGVIRLRVNRGA